MYSPIAVLVYDTDDDKQIHDMTSTIYIPYIVIARHEAIHNHKTIS